MKSINFNNFNNKSSATKDTPKTRKKINNLPKDPYSSSGYSLIPVHNWSNSVDSILLCTQLFTENVRVVSPDKFVNLIIANLNNQNNNEIPFLSYPNPAKDLLNVDFGNVNYAFLVNAEITIYDVFGKLICQKNLSSNDFLGVFIDLSEFNNGIYILKLNANKHLIERKFLKIN